MLEPVQRLPRYEMLLRDYLKKVPKDNPDYEFAHSEYALYQTDLFITCLYSLFTWPGGFSMFPGCYVALFPSNAPIPLLKVVDAF